MWIFSPDGSVRQRVGTGLGPGTTGWGPEWAPAWSPDGRWLAIEHDDHVMLVNVDDWRVIRLEQAWQPAWSLDGRHLAVVTGSYAVDVMNPDGSGRVTVWRYRVSAGRLAPLTPTPRALAGDVSWSAAIGGVACLTWELCTVDDGRPR